MRRLILGLLLFGTTLELTMLGQETEVDSLRKIVTREAPVYPELARKMNLEGTVKLQVMVAPNGVVKSVQAVGGHPVLVKAAEDSVQRFRWVPAKQESKELVEMRFHLK